MRERKESAHGVHVMTWHEVWPISMQSSSVILLICFFYYLIDVSGTNWVQSISVEPWVLHCTETNWLVEWNLSRSVRHTLSWYWGSLFVCAWDCMETLANHSSLFFSWSEENSDCRIRSGDFHNATQPFYSFYCICDYYTRIYYYLPNQYKTAYTCFNKTWVVWKQCFHTNICLFFFSVTLF